jgi:chromate transport protein ChrA
VIPELVWRFVLVSALAFGGGQAALPLVERLAIAETGWLKPTSRPRWRSATSRPAPC